MERKYTWFPLTSCTIEDFCEEVSEHFQIGWYAFLSAQTGELYSSLDKTIDLYKRT